MVYNIVLQPGAEYDIDIVYQWYEQIRIGLGKQFLTELVLTTYPPSPSHRLFSALFVVVRQQAL